MKPGLIAILVGLLMTACGSADPPTSVPVESEPTTLPGDPAIYAERDPRNSRLLQIMEDLPPAFKDEGVWFTDYARSRELAGAPPPSTLAEYLAMSEEESQAVAVAMRGLAMGPGLFASIRDSVAEWDQRLGFSQFAVSVAVNTGESNPEIPPREAAYMLLEYDQEKFRQGLIDLGYVEGSMNGVTYYDAPRSTLEKTRSDPMSFVAYLSMNRVILAEETLAYAGTKLVDLLPAIPGVGPGDAPTLSDDAAFYEIAASLRNPVSAALLTRSMVLQPEAARPPRYEKPENWGNLHQWEALGMGFGVSGGVPRFALSLFYPDPDAAKADAQELVLRMAHYDSAIPLMYPEMGEVQLAAMPKQPIDEMCGELNGGYQSGETSSTLTVRCDVTDPARASIWWSVLLNMRDLGFLLP